MAKKKTKDSDLELAWNFGLDAEVVMANLILDSELTKNSVEATNTAFLSAFIGLASRLAYACDGDELLKVTKQAIDKVEDYKSGHACGDCEGCEKETKVSPAPKSVTNKMH